MADRGKYHGQRLKTKDVLRLYAAGERDFRRAILRGCNFRETDLSGADFTGADIRSAQFINARLQGATFCHAKGGLQRRWMLFQLGLVVLIATISGFLQGFAGYVLGFYFASGDTADLIAAIAGTILVAFTFFAIARQGFTVQALGSIAIAVAIAVAIAATVAVVTAVAGAGIVAVAVAIAVAAAVAVAFAVAGAVAGASAFVGAFVGAVTVAVAVAFAFAGVGAFVGTVAVAGSSISLSLYIHHRIRQHDPKFENLRIIGLALSALGGTTFSGANLTQGSFAHAHLKSSNFTDSRQHLTTLTYVRWHGAQELDQARLGISNLQDPRVRDLLVNLKGANQDFSNADLRGTNLAGAELHGANLTEAQCIGTDFTGAQLTGACLAAWNIDETTILKDIDCEYVFLKEQPDRYGNRERRPHNPDKVFQPGDFEKFFKEMLDTVQILIRQGIHPQVFKDTLAQLMADYELPDDAVQGFEKKGEDMLVTVAVPANTDKGQFEHDFDELQVLKLEAAKAQGLLEGERKRADTLEAILLKHGPNTSTVNVNNTAMTNSNNPNISAGDGGFINTGSMEGNVVNLGELSGQVTVQINQLPDATPSADQPSLKDLLTQLQAAVEADTELSEVEKKEALGEVGKLAEAGTKSQENAMQRMAKRAAANLKSITEPLTEASKLATICKSLLPMIMTLF